MNGNRVLYANDDVQGTSNGPKEAVRSVIGWQNLGSADTLRTRRYNLR